VLKQHHDEGAPEEDLPIVRWCCLRGLHNIQEALQQILDNYPSKPVAWCLRRIIFPWGRRFLPPSDELTHQVAELSQIPGATRNRLCHGIYTGSDSNAPVQRLEEALHAVIAAEKIEPKLASLSRKMDSQQRIASALEKQLITNDEAQQLQLAERLTAEVIAVDAFPPGKL
jgi:acyl-CoA dehydrogenase